MPYKYKSLRIYVGDFDTIQSDILQAIYDLFIEDSEPVVYRTIVNKLGTLTNNAVAGRMRRLEEDGYIYRDRGGNWFLTKKGMPKGYMGYEKGSHAYKRHKFVELMTRHANQ